VWRCERVTCEEINRVDTGGENAAQRTLRDWECSRGDRGGEFAPGDRLRGCGWGHTGETGFERAGAGERSVCVCDDADDRTKTNTNTNTKADSNIDSNANDNSNPNNSDDTSASASANASA
jgi:hypothetical protein